MQDLATALPQDPTGAEPAPAPVPQQADSRPRIVVVGGGAAGLELVTRLGDRLGRRQQARITLIEKSRTHIWKPLLHSIAAGGLSPSQHELNYLAQARWHHFVCRMGALTAIDRQAKTIRVAATLDEEGREVTPERNFPYDISDPGDWQRDQ